MFGMFTGGPKNTPQQKVSKQKDALIIKWIATTLSSGVPLLERQSNQLLYLINQLDDLNDEHLIDSIIHSNNDTLVKAMLYRARVIGQDLNKGIIGEMIRNRSRFTITNSPENAAAKQAKANANAKAAKNAAAAAAEAKQHQNEIDSLQKEINSIERNTGHTQQVVDLKKKKRDAIIKYNQTLLDNAKSDAQDDIEELKINLKDRGAQLQIEAVKNTVNRLLTDAENKLVTFQRTVEQGKNTSNTYETSITETTYDTIEAINHKMNELREEYAKRPSNNAINSTLTSLNVTKQTGGLPSFMPTVFKGTPEDPTQQAARLKPLVDDYIDTYTRFFEEPESIYESYLKPAEAINKETSTLIRNLKRKEDLISIYANNAKVLSLVKRALSDLRITDESVLIKYFDDVIKSVLDSRYKLVKNAINKKPLVIPMGDELYEDIQDVLKHDTLLNVIQEKWELLENKFSRITEQIRNNQAVLMNTQSVLSIGNYKIKNILLNYIDGKYDNYTYVPLKLENVFSEVESRTEPNKSVVDSIKKYAELRGKVNLGKSTTVGANNIPADINLDALEDDLQELNEQEGVLDEISETRYPDLHRALVCMKQPRTGGKRKSTRKHAKRARKHRSRRNRK